MFDMKSLIILRVKTVQILAVVKFLLGNTNCIAILFYT